ncbi:MAG: tRNA lysidine(34) synthetase TilS [Pyrinomonadaceae bacterium]|nr:tRNA lysidine(34) synthetase TilS [Pyrinomonadaceae bacterium]
MQNFVRNLITEWRKLELPFAGETFIAAVSGGADSVSLLLALHELKKLEKLNLRFIIAHFNHRLRGEASDQDEQFVKILASRFNFELALGKGQICADKGNLEQNARELRYRFLAETAENLDAYAVLTAHTLNDQAETFLSNLLRGSGLEGLGGMKPLRSLKSQVSSLKSEENCQSNDKSKIENRKSKILLIRPLLSWAQREATENFCRLNEIEFRHDAMNDDLKFNRVRIRKILLPMLKEFNPKIIETLAKTAALLSEDALFLETVRKEKVNKYTEPTTDEERITENRKPIIESQIEDLPLKDLKDIFPSIRRLILRDWLKKNRGNLRRLELKHIEAIEQLIFSRKSGRLIELPGGAKIVKKDGKLVFQKTKVEKT